MLASEQFHVQPCETDDWFDTILDTDTKLFIDPFLVFKEASGFWSDAHSILIGHFNACFTLIASSRGNRDAVAYKRAVALLTFREPKEMCLGYTSQGTSGLGGGVERAGAIARAIEDAIQRGLTSLRHFEELGIFNKGIGPDMISDMVCNILKPKFVEYTQGIATTHSIPMAEHGVFPASYDQTRNAWSSGRTQLPTNPFTSNPILFVPARFLRELPTLNADDWWTSYEAEQVRNDINYEVLGKVDKQTIVDTARQHQQKVEQWTQGKETGNGSPYNLAKDPLGVYLWDKVTRDFASATPLQLALPQTADEFFAVIDSVIAQFRLFVEQNGGWRLLWNDDNSEKNEEAAQLVFLGIARSYCRANNIIIDREVQLGRGPVDFKFSNGFVRRALLEIKKLHNGRFWEGLGAQLPSYCDSDSCRDAWFLALQYRNDGVSAGRLIDLPTRSQAWSASSGLRIRYASVDARPQQSASRLTAS